MAKFRSITWECLDTSSAPFCSGSNSNITSRKVLSGVFWAYSGSAFEASQKCLAEKVFRKISDAGGIGTLSELKFLEAGL